MPRRSAAMSIAPPAPVATGNPSRACWEAKTLFRNCLAVVGGLDLLVSGCSVCKCCVCCERCRGGKHLFPAAAAMLTVGSAASVRHWARSSAASLSKPENAFRQAQRRFFRRGSPPRRQQHAAFALKMQRLTRSSLSSSAASSRAASRSG